MSEARLAVLVLGGLVVLGAFSVALAVGLAVLSPSSRPTAAAAGAGGALLAALGLGLLRSAIAQLDSDRISPTGTACWRHGRDRQRCRIPLRAHR